MNRHIYKHDRSVDEYKELKDYGMFTSAGSFEGIVVYV